MAKSVNGNKVNKRTKDKKKTKESKTSARRLRAFKKQVAALELRVKGESFRSIALELKYAGPSGAYKAVEAALERTLTARSEHLRQLELERLDKLMLIPWKRATIAGELVAIDRVLKIMERRAKLTGIDAPTEFTLADIQSIARKVIHVVSAEVEDKKTRARIFDELGFGPEADDD